jgi:hypothetical protein
MAQWDKGLNDLETLVGVTEGVINPLLAGSFFCFEVSSQATIPLCAARSRMPVWCLCRSVGGGTRSPNKSSSRSATWRPHGPSSLIAGVCAPLCPEKRRCAL